MRPKEMWVQQPKQTNQRKKNINKIWHMLKKEEMDWLAQQYQKSPEDN